MRNFGEFMAKRDRDNKDHLRVLGVILKKAGFRVKPHLDEHDDPYLYVRRPDKVNQAIQDLKFGGIRLYARGKDIICYRVQMRHDTEPFGTTYQLDVGGMYKELLDDEPEKKLGYIIIYHIIRELVDFFVQSAAADQKQDAEQQDSQMGAVVVGGTGSDYSSKVSDLRRS